MSLREIQLSDVAVDAPPEVIEFLRVAGERVSDFMRTNPERKTGFVPSDYFSVYRTLQVIMEVKLASGNSFCEWGSGFGVVASLAAMLGLDVCGIEIDSRLVEAARLLASDFDIPVEFAHGSMFPPSADDSRAEAYADNNEKYFWLMQEAENAYDILGLAIDNFDIVFAYPWPGEEHLMEQLFDDNAATGALLLTYSDYAPITIRQKTEENFT